MLRAAFCAGVRTVLIPEDNVQNLEDIDPIVREGLTFLPCRRASEVLKHALLGAPMETRTKKHSDRETVPELVPHRSESASLPAAR